MGTEFGAFNPASVCKFIIYFNALDERRGIPAVEKYERPMNAGVVGYSALCTYMAFRALYPRRPLRSAGGCRGKHICSGGQEA
jgi:hypothetical protein